MLRKLIPGLVVLVLVGAGCGAPDQRVGDSDAGMPSPWFVDDATTRAGETPPPVPSDSPNPWLEKAPAPGDEEPALDPDTSGDTVEPGEDPDETAAADPGGTTTIPQRTEDDVKREPERVPQEDLEPPPAVVGEVPPDILDPILADAAERSGVDVGSLVVVRGEAVIWSDGSLGCAEPGMMYTQALVEGYWVVIAAGSAELDYRVTGSGQFVLCTSPGPGGGTVPSR